MIDRFGKPLYMFWKAHELEWIMAASSLPKRERIMAYRDISAMTGRSINAIHSRANRLKAEERQKSRQWLELYLRKNWASGGFPAAPRRVWVETPTMASNARVAPAVDSLEIADG